MAINPRTMARQVSAAMTLVSLAGLALAAVLTVPGARGTIPAAAAPGQGAAIPPARSVEVVAPAPPAGFQLIRARSVAVTDVIVKETAGELETLAGERKAADILARSDAPTPATSWDGTPVLRSTVPAVPAAGTPAPPAVPAAPAPSATPAPAPAVTPAPPVDAWTDAEIATALKECMTLLGPAAAEIEPIEPMKKGACGAAAPVKLKSVGHTSKVEFAPAVEVNCKLAVKLADWVETKLQPAARDVLGSPVKRIVGGGGYSCRNRYGLANAPLSEHALANAVDLPAFVLADGRTIKVASDWGPTQRDLEAAKIAAAKAASEPAKKDDPAAKPDAAAGKEAKPAKTDAVKADTKAETATAQSGKDVTTKRGDDKPKLVSLKGVGAQKLGAGPALGTARPAVAPDARPTVSGRFLRKISEGACSTFGTVLGPEANDAHRDHFHFDLKERRKSAYCQ